MPITTAEELAQRALDHNLLNQWQLQNIWGELGTQDISLDALRRLLLSRDLLTFYQIENLIAGNREGYFYGDFKVLYLVGTGTFARVYRAVNAADGQVVAVKVLRKRFAEVPIEAERFHREGRMGMTLNHPNIVPIFEVGTDPKRPYIVIEFVEGRNLREFIKVRKIFEPLEATRLMLDVCNGLDYAAKKGLYHRDLKMSNVLVSSHGQAKLVDFGLAGADNTAAEDTSNKNPNPRAIDYAGLEKSSGVAKNDSRSDIFFVGCMYYHMLSGIEPMLPTKDRAERLSRARYQDIPPISQAISGLRADIAAAVNKAIQFNADRRYQTPGEMAADLQAILEGRTGVAASGADAGGASGEDATVREGLDSFGNPRKLMVVEGDAALQDAFRQKFKRNGYRVLVTSDPHRALALFDDDLQAFDLALFSTGEIGSAALEVFNEFGESERTKKIPAVLLLGDRHRNWKNDAKAAPHRPVVSMPLTLRQLRETLVQAVQATRTEEA